MRLGKRPLGFVAGVSVILVYLAFTLIAYLLYPTPYSPSANWLGDFGNHNLNPSGAVFYDVGVVLTGILLFAFVCGYLRWEEGQRRAKKILMGIGVVSGLAAGVSLALTGYFPLPAAEHGFISMMFTFNFGDFLIFSTAALFAHPKFIRPIAYYAFISAGVNLYFSIFSNTPIFEWLDIGMFLGYAALMSYNFWSSFALVDATKVEYHRPSAKLRSAVLTIASRIDQ